MPKRLAGPVACVLLGGAVIACVASYRHRFDSPWEVVSRAARPCDQPGCDMCEAERARLRASPGPSPDVIMDAIEAGRPLTVTKERPGRDGADSRHASADIQVTGHPRSEPERLPRAGDAPP
jgi:hypothetical protein